MAPINPVILVNRGPSRRSYQSNVSTAYEPQTSSTQPPEVLSHITSFNESTIKFSVKPFQPLIQRRSESTGAVLGPVLAIVFVVIILLVVIVYLNACARKSQKAEQKKKKEEKKKGKCGGGDKDKKKCGKDDEKKEKKKKDDKKKKKDKKKERRRRQKRRERDRRRAMLNLQLNAGNMRGADPIMQPAGPNEMDAPQIIFPEELEAMRQHQANWLQQQLEQAEQPTSSASSSSSSSSSNS